MPAVLVLLFLGFPVLELYVVLQASRLIGGWETIGALLALSIAGAWLVKREGLRAWLRFREALAAPRIPTREVIDGAVILLAGALLLAPGFVSDALGLLLLLPPTRALLVRILRGRVQASIGLGGTAWPRMGPRAGRGDSVDIEVEVVEVRRNEPPESEALGPGGP